jgi:hypothetical protein
VEAELQFRGMKNITPLFVLAISFLTACTKPQPEKTKNDTTWYYGQEIPTTSLFPPKYNRTWKGIDCDSVLVINNNPEATLNYYAPLDDLRLFYCGELYEMEAVNGTKFGFIISADTCKVYRFERGRFTCTTRMPLKTKFNDFQVSGLSPLYTTDLDVDGYKDIVLELRTYDDAGNIEFYGLRYDPAKNTLVPLHGNPVENMITYPAAKQIRGIHLGDSCRSSGKMVYRISGDSLVTAETVWLRPVCGGTDYGFSNIEHCVYTGKKSDCRMERLPSVVAQETFDAMLWMTSSSQEVR